MPAERFEVIRCLPNAEPPGSSFRRWLAAFGDRAIAVAAEYADPEALPPDPSRTVGHR